MNEINKTGYLELVPEYETHECTIFAWPSRPDVWRGNGFFAQQQLLQLINVVSEFEPVVLLCDGTSYSSVTSLIGERVRVIELSYNDIWLRDTSPIFVRTCSSIRSLGFGFNAWGGIYDPYDLDDMLSLKISNLLNVKHRQCDFVLEGGALSFNGRNQILTTEECLLNSNRENNLTKDEYEGKFRELLNDPEVIWLPHGLKYDETSGHVDEICVFGGDDHILVAYTESERDPNYERTQAAIEVLNHLQERRPELRISKIPLPPQLVMSEERASGYYAAYNSLPRNAGEIYATSYLNFIFVNNGVVVPSFGLEEDSSALDLFRKIFPDREVVSSRCDEFVFGGGGPHCITRDVPAL